MSHRATLYSFVPQGNRRRTRRVFPCSGPTCSIFNYDANRSRTRILLVTPLDPCHPLRSPVSHSHPRFLSSVCNTASRTRKIPHCSRSVSRLPRRVQHWRRQSSQCSSLRAFSPFPCRSRRSVTWCYLGCHSRYKSICHHGHVRPGFLVRSAPRTPGQEHAWRRHERLLGVFDRDQ